MSLVSEVVALVVLAFPWAAPDMLDGCGRSRRLEEESEG